MATGMQYDPGIPIYLQIMQRIRLRVVRGEWPPGARVPGVRELAAEFEVNPNTMQRALSELEREGLLYSERTAGRFVTQDAGEIEGTRARMAQEMVAVFLRQMETMGYTRPQIAELLLSLQDGGTADRT